VHWLVIFLRASLAPTQNFDELHVIFTLFFFQGPSAVRGRFRGALLSDSFAIILLPLPLVNKIFAIFYC
jgi:hypothetical protein